MQEASTRLTRRQQKARTRDRLLAAAGRVIGRRGLGAASVDQISEDAGYSSGAFYGNFESKDEVFAAALAYHAEGRERFLRERGEAGSGAGRLAVELEWVKQLDDWQVLFLLEIFTHGARSERLRPAVCDYLVAARERLQEGLEASAVDRGARLGAPPAQLAALVLATEIGLLVQRLYDNDVGADPSLLWKLIGQPVADGPEPPA